MGPRWRVIRRRSYAGETFLSMPKNGSTVEECDDVGDVVEEGSGVRVSEGCEWNDAVVVGVDTLTEYESCVKCSAKVMVDSDKPKLGRCGKCGMLQRIDSCAKKWSATIILKAGQYMKTVKAFDAVITSIVGSKCVSEEGLLLAEPFSVAVSPSNVIIRISRD